MALNVFSCKMLICFIQLFYLRCQLPCPSLRIVVYVFRDLDKLENINSATKMFLNLFGKTFFLPGQKILYRNNVYESEKTEKHLRKYNVFATLYKYFMFLHHYAGVDNPYNRQGINLLHDYACCMLYLQMIKLTPLADSTKSSHHKPTRWDSSFKTGFKICAAIVVPRASIGWLTITHCFYRFYAFSNAAYDL